MTMKFSLISDMHLDHPQLKTPYELLEKNVVVAGDTANGLLGLKFLNKLRRKGHTVWAVDGNHEHYGNESRGRHYLETLKGFQKDNFNNGFMENVPIVLRNGWYHISDPFYWASYMNDRKYSVMTYKEVNEQALIDAQEIEQALYLWREWGAKGIVVTHTAPTLETLDPKYKGHFSNEWYFNPHVEWMLSEYRDHIHVWCHGHTHAFADKIVHGTRVVCNPRGYPGENPNWKPFTVEI